MKTLSLILAVLLLGQLAQAEGLDACYLEARKNYFSIKDSAIICKGLVGDTCFMEARKTYYSVRESADICRNVINSRCFLEARKLFYPIGDAAKLCRGLMNPACYQEMRRSFSIKDSAEICRAGVVCQGR